MQKMIYKNAGNPEGEIVWMINAYRGADGKFKAIIVRDIKDKNGMPNSWDVTPYEEVKLNRLRFPNEDYEKMFPRK